MYLGEGEGLRHLALLQWLILQRVTPHGRLNLCNDAILTWVIHDGGERLHLHEVACHVFFDLCIAEGTALLAAERDGV